MLPDRVSNPGPLTYESGALLIGLRGRHLCMEKWQCNMFTLIIVVAMVIMFLRYLLFGLKSYVMLYDLYDVLKVARSSGILSYIFILFVPRISIQCTQYYMQLKTSH